MLQLRTALLGASEGSEISGGVVVLEPSLEEYGAVLDFLRSWTAPNLYFDQEFLAAYWRMKGVHVNVLPLTYNTLPELLDTVGFLTPEEGVAATSGTKIVHFWHQYNPLFPDGGENTEVQVVARLKNRILGEWYDKLWDLHQTGLRRGLGPDYYPNWERCVNLSRETYGEVNARNFVPVLSSGHGGNCRHRTAIFSSDEALMA